MAMSAIERTMTLIHMPVPSIRGSSYGTARLFSQSASSIPLVLLAALVAIYVVLGVLYESYSQPLTILSDATLGWIGSALLALLVTNTEFSIIAFLGILLLIGIVKKNRDLSMVDFALDAERALGLDPQEAIVRACSLRFRPIIMTTCAAIAGALPLAIASGNGTELRRPLGISIVGGLIVSQILTLYTTPVVYLFIHRYWSQRRRRLAQRASSLPAWAALPAGPPSEHSSHWRSSAGDAGRRCGGLGVQRPHRRCHTEGHDRSRPLDLHRGLSATHLDDHRTARPRDDDWRGRAARPHRLDRTHTLLRTWLGFILTSLVFIAMSGS